MANLSKAQIDELKEKGLITQVVPSDDLASKTVDGLKIEKYVTVTDPSADIEAAVTHEIPVESISLNKTVVILLSDDSINLTATVLPVDTTEPAVEWSTSTNAVQITPLDEGDEGHYHDCEVLAALKGTAIVTATAGDKSATCEFIVDPSISLNEEQLQLHVGDTFQLVATTFPEDAEVVWSSSDPDKVSVSDTGLVTVIDLILDPVEIYASIFDDFTSETCNVTVLDE